MARRRKAAGRADADPAIVTGVRPRDVSRRQVAAEFRALVRGGARLLPSGTARRDPEVLLSRKYAPRHAVSLFDAAYYLTDFRFEEGLNFFVAYVGLRGRSRSGAPGGIRDLYPRIFYKDSSLIWRVVSHLISNDHEHWVGKGDVRVVQDGHHEVIASDEDTTNLPYEIQTALDEISRRRKPTRDEEATRMILRNAPGHRIRPYADFSAPRRRAAERHRLNGGRPVARLSRRGDPRSLRFARGFEPDLDGGVIEVGKSGSRLYGGAVHKYRVLSANRRVQYQFVVSPTHVWINPPQPLTIEITSYGVRALHVPADEEIFVPGYEYHYVDGGDPAELHSQIPPGWAGAPSPVDPDRADASRWIEALPVIRTFRRKILE